ncbi:MAG: IPTL-CTERM sorting domain-containing protein [Phycisphaerae bacterium]
MYLRPIIIFLVAADLGFGQIVSYDATSFPEDTGDDWTRLDFINLADRWLEDGWLIPAPIVLPCPPQCTTQDFYRRELEDQTGLDRWFLTWVMTTDGPEVFSAGAPAAIVASGNNGVSYHFTIAKDEVRFLRDAALPIVFTDLTPGAHVFRLELDNTPPPGTYLFKIDGEVIDSGTAERIFPKTDSFIVFGARAAVEDSTTKWNFIEFGSMDKQEVPTLSQWGILVLTLLLLAAGTILFKHRRFPFPCPTP